MNLKWIKIVFISFLWSCVFTSALFAWPTVNGVAICTSSYTQMNPVIVGDGSGGAIIAWQDSRNGADYNIYTQHIDISGIPTWTPNGVAICTAGEAQTNPAITSDGSGGAIITWQDNRNSTDYNIYAQRINSTGNVLWTLNGVAVCTASGNKENPCIANNGSGGAFIGWRDNGYEIYVQEISSTGSLATTIRGIDFEASGTDARPQIAPIGPGSAMLTWGAWGATQVKRINSGCVFPWTKVDVGGGGSGEYYPRIVADGAGGAIVTWSDGYIHAQLINSIGKAQWSNNLICNAANDQKHAVLTRDAGNGAIIAWEDYRAGTSNTDIYVQHVNSIGNTTWRYNGVAVCTSVNNQQYPVIVSDSAGGAIIVWQDERNGGGNPDIYAQRIDYLGNLMWGNSTTGIAICTAVNEQTQPQIINYPLGTDIMAIITWNDLRNGMDVNIYAQSVYGDGSVNKFLPGSIVFSDPEHPNRNVIGTVADGAAQVLIKLVFSYQTSGIATFSIVDNFGNTYGQLTGTNPISFSNGTASLMYIAPADYPSGDALIRVVYGTTTVERTLYIKPAPVVLVHGLWDDPKGWSDFGDFAHGVSGSVRLDKTFPFVYAVNYSGPDAAKSFRENAHVVPSGIEAVLNLAASAEYVAKKADVVCHSMGGDLARWYLESLPNTPAYRNDIRRLITIGTPHSGSQIADLLIYWRDYDPYLWWVVSNVLNMIGNSTWSGALDDLASNSNTMDNILNNPNSLNLAVSRTAVHSINCDAGLWRYVPYYPPEFSLIRKVAGYSAYPFFEIALLVLRLRMT